ncbi:hypothetical protein HIM_05289 [Hirsutella minnesotensis 3608]|uniref:PBP domain-containing protein n=1 Tax=Hirsutella minnesotensis 3608 TaxID=1043627 RepID=A0A0F7ZUS3_9HYPO|nr:hypothetical protein HIM_05289 [Hirsutella minnesotensis 3608]
MAPLRSLFAAALAIFAVPCLAVEPAAVYDGGHGKDGKIELRIANGGAGQSGLIKELADAFIRSQAKNKTGGAFRVAWYRSDTTYTIEYLKSGTVDVGITYDPAAEQIAIDKGIAKSPSYYAFRDHFLLVGPKSNPANLTKSSGILNMFSQIRDAAEGNMTSPPVRFLSRYDKSATNIKESKLWTQVGQVPWATSYSPWYHQYIAFPIEALTAAIKLEEYTISDRGTLLSLDSRLRNETVVYKASTDNPDDLLLNPAHLLVASKPKNSQMAERFAKWLVSREGQMVVAGFKKGGEQLYTPAPNNSTRSAR